MDMELYEVAVLEQPSETEICDTNAGARLVFGPVPVVAKDLQDACLRVAIDHAAELQNIDRDSMKVLARPFL
jgi:hypothetical protein